MILENKWILGLSTLFALGCGTVRTDSRYYSTTAVIDETAVSLPDAVSTQLVETPGSALKSGAATVGFFPSPNCRKPDGTGRLREACALLLQLLETAAKKRGFELFRWEHFGSSPWDTGEIPGPDVVFVVDDAEIHWTAPSDFRLRELTASEQKGPASHEPVRLEEPEAVADRCRSAMDKAYPRSEIPPRIRYVSAAVQMLSAEDRVEKWYFSDREANRDEASSRTNELFFEAAGTKKRGLGGAVAGGLLTAMGIGALATGLVLYQTGESLTERNTGAGLAWGSAILFGIGLPIGAVGIVRELRDPVYPAPDAVICRENSQVDNPFLETAATDTVAPISPDYTRQATDAFTAVVRRFFNALDRLRAEAPAVDDPSSAPDEDVPMPEGTAPIDAASLNKKGGAQ